MSPVLLNIHLEPLLVDTIVIYRFAQCSDISEVSQRVLM